MTTYTTRAAELRQEAYRRRVAAFGLRALLAPYSVARVPEQRRAGK